MPVIPGKPGMTAITYIRLAVKHTGLMLTPE